MFFAAVLAAATFAGCDGSSGGSSGGPLYISGVSKIHAVDDAWAIVAAALKADDCAQLSVGFEQLAAAMTDIIEPSTLAEITTDYYLLEQLTRITDQFVALNMPRGSVVRRCLDAAPRDRKLLANWGRIAMSNAHITMERVKRGKVPKPS